MACSAVPGSEGERQCQSFATDFAVTGATRQHMSSWNGGNCGKGGGERGLTRKNVFFFSSLFPLLWMKWETAAGEGSGTERKTQLWRLCNRQKWVPWWHRECESLPCTPMSNCALLAWEPVCFGEAAERLFSPALAYGHLMSTPPPTLPLWPAGRIAHGVRLDQVKRSI